MIVCCYNYVILLVAWHTLDGEFISLKIVSPPPFSSRGILFLGIHGCFATSSTWAIFYFYFSSPFSCLFFPLFITLIVVSSSVVSAILHKPKSVYFDFWRNVIRKRVSLARRLYSWKRESWQLVEINTLLAPHLHVRCIWSRMHLSVGQLSRHWLGIKRVATY